MNEKYIPLYKVDVGSKAEIFKLLSTGLLRRRMLDQDIPGPP